MNTRRQLISFLLALFMVLGTITPLFAENDSVTVLPPRIADEEEPNDNIVIMNGDREEKEETSDSPIILNNNRDESNVEDVKADKNAPTILENRDDNNVTILPPIKNEDKNTKPEPKEELKKEESKDPVEVQVLNKRDIKEGDKKEEGKVSLVLLNDKPASVNEEVYSKIKWVKDDFNIDGDKILGLSDSGLKKVKANKKLVIPEIENVNTIEKQAFLGLGLRVVEISKNITLIEDEAFKDNGLTKVVINGKGKTIAGSAFGEEFLSEYKKSEKDVFLYEFEGLQIGEEIVSDAVGFSNMYNYSIGNGWVLGDFTYDDEKRAVTGFSSQGQEKLKTNKNLVIPGAIPETFARGYDNLHKVEIIAKNAFYLKGLESVDFSNCLNLIEIEGEAFSNNDSLKFVDFSNCKNLAKIGQGAFWLGRIESLDLSDCVNLIAIDLGAFQGNFIKKLNLKNLNKLETIGSGSFWMNNLTEVDLSDCTSLKSIESKAFLVIETILHLT